MYKLEDYKVRVFAYYDIEVKAESNLKAHQEAMAVASELALDHKAMWAKTIGKGEKDGNN